MDQKKPPVPDTSSSSDTRPGEKKLHHIAIRHSAKIMRERVKQRTDAWAKICQSTEAIIRLNTTNAPNETHSELQQICNSYQTYYNTAKDLPNTVPTPEAFNHAVEHLTKIANDIHQFGLSNLTEKICYNMADIIGQPNDFQTATLKSGADNTSPLSVLFNVTDIWRNQAIDRALPKEYVRENSVGQGVTVAALNLIFALKSMGDCLKAQGFAIESERF